MRAANSPFVVLDVDAPITQSSILGVPIAFKGHLASAHPRPQAITRTTRTRGQTEDSRPRSWGQWRNQGGAKRGRRSLSYVGGSGTWA
jgi:hypothetical protein